VQHEGVLNFAVDSRIPSSGGGAEVMVSLMDRVVVPEHVLVRFLDKESVLLNIETERYFGLDETGTRMWQLVTAAPKIEVAYQQLLDEYDVEPGLLRENLTDLLSRLVENGLLQVTSPDVGTAPAI
jgi:Coenzyme PQQ synthesis protein D (PqqD)